ncbi:ANTAR domain-containing protein [Egicoccus sp. AB-alg6-2]|uniref:ANTAR domain-containing protein n=1 Tax=Egicoccus sp. AB-alg6-2 TaxID=3242692 RepID=UPI00359E954C
MLEAAISRLRADNEGLRTSLRHRAVIEQAKGVLMARTGCSPDQAFERLVRHSQQSQQKLVRVAAAVVGATVTATEPVAADADFDLGALFGTAGSDDDGPARRADRRLAGVALEAAHDLEELAQILAHEAAGDLAPDAVLLAAIEPDGALRLVAGTGYDRQTMSAWQRIPPSLDIPLVAAARSHTPVLLDDFDARSERYPATRQIPRVYEAQASVPLQAGGRTVGVIGMSWRARRRFDEADQRRLVEIARQTVAPFLRLLVLDDEELPHVAVEVMRTRWFKAALDAVIVPLFLLTPLRDPDGTVRDFEVIFVNRAALAADDTDASRIVGRTVLTLYPRTAGRHLFGVFCDALESGTAAHFDRIPALELVDGTADDSVVELSVAPIGDGLLVSWRRRTE